MATVEEQILEQLKENNRLLKSGGGTSSTTSGTSTAGASGALGAVYKKAADDFNPLSLAVTGVSAAMGAAKSVYSDLESVIKPNLDTWRKLSDTGSSFGGSIVDMASSAKEARLSLDSFANLIENNAGRFNGLSGQIGKGADAFSHFSGEFFASTNHGVETLKALGYTTEGINDVLALQLNNYTTIDLQDKKAKADAIASATALAVEMDSMAKLTGVSRKQQEEIMKKAQVDGQAEAKLRLITAGKGEEETRAIRDNYEKQRLAAALRGEEQLFKETFALGTVVSKEAQIQVAVNGKQAQATMDSANAAVKGNIEESQQFSQQATQEMLKNQKDANYLTMATLGPLNAVGKATSDQLTTNLPLYKAEQAVRAEMMKDEKFAALSKDEQDKRIYQEALNRAKAPPTGPSAESTKMLVNLESRADDVANALQQGIVKPMNEDVAPALKKFNEGLIGGNVTYNGKQTTFARASAETVASEFKNPPSTQGPNSSPIINASANSKAPEYTGEGLLKGLADLGRTADLLLVRTVNAASDDKSRANGRANGSPGISSFLGGGNFNSMFENFGAGTPMTLHGEEVVATKEQMNQIMQKAQGAIGSAQNMFGNAKSTLDDVVQGLERLNSSIMQAVSHMSSVADNAQKQVKATKSLSNNRYAG